MAKVKVTKDDIKNNNVELPEGYRIAKYKTQKELNDELLVTIGNLEAENDIVPSDNELIDFAKLDHPYYRNLELIEQLKKELSNGI